MSRLHLPLILALAGGSGALPRAAAGQTSAPAGQTSAPAGQTSTAAASSGVHLSWVRAASAATCPDATHVETDVARRLGQSPFTAAASRSIEVLVTRDDASWKADIDVREANGARVGSRSVSSEAATCDSLASAAALAIALFIDPQAMLLRTSPAPLAETPPRTEPLTPVQDHPTSQPSPASRLAPHGSLVVTALAATRLLPRTAVGASLIGEVDLTDHVAVSVAAAFLPEQAQVRDDSDVAFGMTWGALGPCYRFLRRDNLALSGCASILLGAAHATVLRPQAWDAGERFWWAAGTGVAWQWSPAPPLLMRMGVDVVIPLARRDNVVESGATLARTSVFSEPDVAGTAHLGLGVEF